MNKKMLLASALIGLTCGSSFCADWDIGCCFKTLPNAKGWTDVNLTREKLYQLYNAKYLNLPKGEFADGLCDWMIREGLTNFNWRKLPKNLRQACDERAAALEAGAKAAPTPKVANEKMLEALETAPELLDTLVDIATEWNADRNTTGGKDGDHAKYTAAAQACKILADYVAGIADPEAKAGAACLILDKLAPAFSLQDMVGNGGPNWDQAITKDGSDTEKHQTGVVNTMKSLKTLGDLTGWGAKDQGIATILGIQDGKLVGQTKQMSKNMRKFDGKDSLIKAWSLDGVADENQM